MSDTSLVDTARYRASHPSGRAHRALRSCSAAPRALARPPRPRIPPVTARQKCVCPGSSPHTRIARAPTYPRQPTCFCCSAPRLLALRPRFINIATSTSLLTQCKPAPTGPLALHTHSPGRRASPVASAVQADRHTAWGGCVKVFFSLLFPFPLSPSCPHTPTSSHARPPTPHTHSRGEEPFPSPLPFKWTAIRLGVDA